MMNLKYKNIIKIVGQFVGVFIIVFLTLYFISNYQSLTSRIKYKFFRQDLNIESVEKDIRKENDSEELIYEDTIVIPKISVVTPIIWTENEDDATENLKLGVSHYADSVMPGESGNSVIIGHSSNYWWEPGDYNTIFANLSLLENNDEIYVYYENKKLLYKVYEEQILNPDDVKSEIFKVQSEPNLILITCTPLGSNINRLLVKSRLFKEK
ncbi:MAG: sortase [Parcubacteria group bacterium]|nr:sortase [Parcubacteria group bacterium]